jgi:hypothetical protein
MPASAATQLSPEERQRLRLEAAEKYMRGDMDVEEFEHQERRYQPDYVRVMQALADSQSRVTYTMKRRVILLGAVVVVIVLGLLIGMVIRLPYGFLEVSGGITAFLLGTLTGIVAGAITTAVRQRPKQGR